MIIKIFLCVFTANQLISVNGTFVKVKSTEIQVCVSFDCITSNKRMVVLAHHVDDDDQEELSAYTSNCFTAPAAGNYMVGVFTQNGDNSLEAPGTFPTISNQFSAPPTPAFCTPGRYYLLYFLAHILYKYNKVRLQI